MKIITKGNFHSITQFHIFNDKKLGNGSFGVVKLALHMATNKYYAIKVINFKDIPSDHETKLIQRQIKLHSAIHHPHIAQLWDTLIDQSNIYMILEYAEEGNLFYYQNTKNKFTEPEAFLYFSQTVKAIENLHLNNIIHRDIKPENLLLDKYFNIKLCDFGWSADNIHTKRATFCGTYQYMSPEMIFNSNSYDYRVDIWALGVLLYEMVHGHAPFKGKSVSQVKQKMLKASYTINEVGITESLRDLIVGLLKFEPTERLSIRQILNHPWIQRMEVIVSSYLVGNQKKNRQPGAVHQLICNMPTQLYNRKTETSSNDIYSHNYSCDSEYDGKDKASLYTNGSSSSANKNFYRKQQNGKYANLDHTPSKFDKEKDQPKSININFSINNFSYVKDSHHNNNSASHANIKHADPSPASKYGNRQDSSNEKYENKFMSPTHAFQLKKKKLMAVKRIKTQHSHNAQSMSSVLLSTSPKSKALVKSKSKDNIIISRREDKQKDKKSSSKLHHKTSRNKNRKSSNNENASSYIAGEKSSVNKQSTTHDQSSIPINSHQATVMEKIAMNLKKHAIKQKTLSSYSSAGNIHSHQFSSHKSGSNHSTTMKIMKKIKSKQKDRDSRLHNNNNSQF